MTATKLLLLISSFADFEVVSGWEEGEWLTNSRFDLDPCNDPVDLVAGKAEVLPVG